MARVAIALLDEHDFRAREIAGHLFVAADDFARRAVQCLELFEFAAGGIHEMHDTRCLDLIAVLINDGAAVIELAGSGRHFLEPCERFT